SIDGSNLRKTSATTPEPATIAVSRATMRPLACKLSGTKSSVVLSPVPMTSLSAAAIGSYRSGFMGLGWLSQSHKCIVHARGFSNWRGDSFDKRKELPRLHSKARSWVAGSGKKKIRAAHAKEKQR